MTTHSLARLRDSDYRAGALERALRGCRDPHPLIRQAARQSADDLLSEIEAARTLSPEIISYDHPPPLPFEAEVLGERSL